MDSKGQTSIELILIIGFILIIVLGIASFFGEDVELSQAMTAARSGAIEGANTDSFAIYPEKEFKSAIEKYPRTISPNSVKIIEIDYINKGFNAKYNKTLIQLQITASSHNVLDSGDRNVLGDRVNFYAKKSICESFSTSNQTNTMYNPAFSNRYMFTTVDVKWV
jgi:uncharacterized protein (UPF0333 family)